MLRNTVINTTSFFYPLGNTPAVCLTQDLLPEQNADILLLGCGDARNILFTAHTSPGRRLDVRCCDIEPAILARNILLFTLLIDDSQSLLCDKIWNIYYHFYLDMESLNLLESQTEKLFKLAESLEQWNTSQYGGKICFCDHRTFNKIKGLWAGYSSRQLDPSDKTKRRSQYEAKIGKAKEVKKNAMGKGLQLSGVRSAAPIGMKAIADLTAVYNDFWEHGTTTGGETKTKKKPAQPNPTFARLSDSSLTLHYGTDPLLGFHLATAYAPLQRDLPHFPKHPKMSNAKKTVQVAYREFHEWTKAFRKSVENGSVLRFFTGDAITFCHTLQKRATNEAYDCANFHCDNWTFDILKLDSRDCGADNDSESHTGPSIFDIIDTSNLIDHLGALNVIIAATPLLADKPTSILFTETLVAHEASLRERIDNMLCSDFGTMSLLLGLAPLEYWTNATAIADVDEGVLDEVMNRTARAHVSGQVRTRLSWRRLSALSRPVSFAMTRGILAPMTLEFDAKALSRFLFSLYRSMFSHEDLRAMMSNLKVQGLQKMSNPYYNRASFAALLKYLKSSMICDWNQLMRHLLDFIEQDFTKLSLGRQYLQELNAYLHIFGVHTVPILKSIDSQPFSTKNIKHVFAWNDIPSVVCLTLRVPRANLKQLTDMHISKLGSPALCCTVESGEKPTRPWANKFAAVQIAAGRIQTVGNRDTSDFSIEVQEDSERCGPEATIVACGLLATPHAITVFANILGPELRIYESSLMNDEEVYITKYMPHLSAYPAPVSNSLARTPTLPETASTAHTTISATFDPSSRRIAKFALKFTLLSPALKNKLADKGSSVEVKVHSHMISTIAIGNTFQLNAVFPAPVVAARRKVRVARASSYVEIICPLLVPLEAESTPEFMYPMSLHPINGRILPINWSTPYVDLDPLPILDAKKKSDMKWLVPHTSMMFSSRERKLREAGMCNATSGDVRVDFKDGLFSIFMHTSGLQGTQANVFSLHQEESGGGQVLLFVSALKLDLANHTVILDAAAIPLTHTLLKDTRMQKALQGLVGRMAVVKVSESELRVWKYVLPSFAERCRTWKHKAGSCEYIKAGEVPLSKGLEIANTPLCSCGNGKIPKGFLADLKIPHLDSVLQSYATRVAISPVFAVPFVEDCFMRNLPFPDGSHGHTSNQDLASLENRVSGQRCNACGSHSKKCNDELAALMTCIRCKIAKYCSKECQKADWKEHRKTCVAA